MTSHLVHSSWAPPRYLITFLSKSAGDAADVSPANRLTSCEGLTFADVDDIRVAAARYLRGLPSVCPESCHMEKNFKLCQTLAVSRRQ